jgi:hypothetical protein
MAIRLLRPAAASRSWTRLDAQTMTKALAAPPMNRMAMKA